MVEGIAVVEGGIARVIEHTLLQAVASGADIERLCSEALSFGFYSVVVSPCHVAQAKALLGGKVRVTTVCGFPLGASLSESKAFEARQAVEQGAGEVDMVMQVGPALEGRWDIVESDIRAVRSEIPDTVLKVIIETCYLDNMQMLRALEAVAGAGADYIKTSSGFGTAGATAPDVRLLKDSARGRIKVKAAGGIRTYEDAMAMVEAGADLIGTSNGVAIVKAS